MMCVLGVQHIGVIEKLSELVRVKQEGLVLEITVSDDILLTF